MMPNDFTIDGNIKYRDYVEKAFSIDSESAKQSLVHIQLAAALSRVQCTDLQLVPNCKVNERYHEDIVIKSTKDFIMCVEVKSHIDPLPNALRHNDLTELFMYARDLKFNRIACA